MKESIHLLRMALNQLHWVSKIDVKFNGGRNASTVRVMKLIHTYLKTRPLSDINLLAIDALSLLEGGTLETTDRAKSVLDIIIEKSETGG